MAGPLPDVSVRQTAAGDAEFLWRMLYFASHSDEEPGVGFEDIRTNPDLTGYISGWRASGHLGVIAESQGRGLGAAWVRLLGDEDRPNPVFVDLDTPELAIAVEPGHEGRGIGSSLMERLMPIAAHRFRGLVLSTRTDNPASRLYERFGFVGTGEMTNRVGTVSVRMIKRF